MNLFTFVVAMPGGKKEVFSFTVHRTYSDHDRLMESEFYSANCTGSSIPQGIHHELEIESPHVWAHQHSKHIHYHTVPESGRQFICWTGALPTLDNALGVLKMWSVGTAYTMIMGKDFTPEYGRDPSTFMERMEKEHGITIRPFDVSEST